MYTGQLNTIISHNILDETRFFETFSTYKIFSLELIAIFCNLRVSLTVRVKIKNFKFVKLIQKNKSKSEPPKSEQVEDKDTSLYATFKEYDLTIVQELKIINLILESIKVIHNQIKIKFNIITVFQYRQLIQMFVTF